MSVQDLYVVVYHDQAHPREGLFLCSPLPELGDGSVIFPILSLSNPFVSVSASVVVVSQPALLSPHFLNIFIRYICRWVGKVQPDMVTCWSRLSCLTLDKRAS